MKKCLLLLSSVCVALAMGVEARSQPDPGPFPACDPASPRALTLVTHKAVPVAYRTGFFVESGPQPETGSAVDRYQPFKVTVSAAGTGRLAHGYSGTLRDRDDAGRWPLRFGRGDGPARVAVTYLETRDGVSCTRTLVSVVDPIRIPNPRLRLKKKVKRRFVKTRFGTIATATRVTVTGRLRRGVRRVIRLDVYTGDVLARSRRLRASRGRFRTTFRFRESASQGPTVVTVVPVFPGNFTETVACDDPFTNGSSDGCRRRLRVGPYRGLIRDCKMTITPSCRYRRGP